MIIPSKKSLKIADEKQLNRIFIRFIDKNGIELECEGDIPSVIKLFAKTVEEKLMMEWGEDDD